MTQEKTKSLLMRPVSCVMCLFSMPVSTSKITRTLFFVWCLLLPVWGGAQEHPMGIPPKLDKAIASGMDQIYNLNFSTAVQTFRSLQDHAEEHPMVSFGVASAHWWRLSIYVLEPDKEESRPFLEWSEKCIKVAEAKIDKGDPTGEGHLVLGGILGLVGRWEATNHNWLTAYFKGRKAVKYLRKAVQINPELYDAYMGLGIFNYYVATLPAVVRVLAFLGGGDVQLGLDQLHKAADYSAYAQTPSRLFLADIYATQLDRSDISLDILKGLCDIYPKSAFLHMLRNISLYNYGDIGELKKSAEAYLTKVNNREYREEWRTQAFFSLGAVEFKSKKWDGALAYFDKAIATQNTKDAFHTWAHLYRGYCLDMLNKREEAKKEYRYVLDVQRRWASWDNAKKRLKKPFSEKEEELTKLKL